MFTNLAHRTKYLLYNVHNVYWKQNPDDAHAQGWLQVYNLKMVQIYVYSLHVIWHGTSMSHVMCEQERLMFKSTPFFLEEQSKTGYSISN